MSKNSEAIVQVSNPATASLKGDGMNTQNFASLEACKRLLDAGIVLETDCYWHFNDWKYEWQLKYRDYFIENWGLVPAPSMAEVWRESCRLKLVLTISSKYTKNMDLLRHNIGG